MTKKSQGYHGVVDMKVCIYCKQPVDDFSRTKDHLIPESKGGCRSKDNAVPSCSKCNRLKEDMTVSEFQKFMERLIKIEYGFVKTKTGYFKRIATSCKEIILQSNPRDINFKNGETEDS